MTLLRCITGSESFRNGSAAMIVSLMHTPDKPLEGKRQYQPGKGIFISEAAKHRYYVTETARPVFLPASHNGVREQGCYWDGNYNVEDGVILKVYARRTQRIGSRPTVDQGVVYIQARDDAPLQRIKLYRVDDPASTNATVLIEGRFDILTLREAGAARVALSQDDLKLTRSEAVRSVMDHEEIATARVPKGRVKVTRVTDHSGRSSVVTTTRARRPIALDD